MKEEKISKGFITGIMMELLMKKMSITKRVLCIMMSAIMLLGTVTIASAKNDTAGWIQDIYTGIDSPTKEGWKYQNTDGTYPKSTWKKINGKYYYFDENEYLLRSTTTPDGFKVDREGIWVENSNSIQAPRSSNPELQALADAAALSNGISLEDNFDYNSTCAESFNPSADYKITLNSTGGMAVKAGHYLRSDSMSGKAAEKVKFEGYGTYNIWSPNIKNVSFKSGRIGGTGGTRESNIRCFVWTDNNYEYNCDENGKVDWIIREHKTRYINN